MEIANKRVGETPLELIRRLHPDSKERYTYAGRLDPLASGVMLILEGDEVHDKDQYLGLSKTYELQVLFGVSSDSYDPLGLIKETVLPPSLTKLDLQAALSNYPHTYSQPYPPYSSKPVSGHPLWWWAREGRLNEVEIPAKDVTIHSLTLDSFTSQPLTSLIPEIISKIKLVKGDFRQDQLIRSWQSLPTNISLPVATLTVSCSSGTYMRSLANDLGKRLSTPALALSIHRTQIGERYINN